MLTTLRPKTMAGSPRDVSTGLTDLDDVLGGLIPGDNIVWSTDDEGVVRMLEDALLREARRRRRPCIYIATTTAPDEVQLRLGRGVAILDARPRGEHADAAVLEEAIMERAHASPVAHVVVDSLHALAHRWGGPQAVAFFSRTCPRLFDAGAIAYWRVLRRDVPRGFIQRLSKVTQCVLEIAGGQLRVVKAEGRPGWLQGQLFQIRVDDRTVRLHSEQALGRLGRGLERIRKERNLSQRDVARLAGVTPSAISQAESGRRGLSVETVLGLAERLGVRLDELFTSAPPAGYVLARHDRTAKQAAENPLLDDPNIGLRAYLIRLAPGESGRPPVAHKGTELVVVASGLVQIDIGAESPVMRAGDALVSARLPVSGWRSVAPNPGVLFWILRD